MMQGRWTGSSGVSQSSPAGRKNLKASASGLKGFKDKLVLRSVIFMASNLRDYIVEAPDGTSLCHTGARRSASDQACL